VIPPCYLHCFQAHPDRNDTTFSAGMVEALLTYIANAYPRAVQICGMLDSMSECIMRGDLLTGYLPGQDTLSVINEYEQSEEKRTYELKERFQLISVPSGFIKLPFV
jgi:hypothetical protein